MDILGKIIERTRTDLVQKKQCVSRSVLERRVAHVPVRGSFSNAITADNIQIIAEIKRASPSKGMICPDFNPAAIARRYEQGGASAISVLTEPHFFRGSLDDLQHVAETVSLPLLRKDFIVDAYQIYEARACAASAVLLIVAALHKQLLREFIQMAESLSLAALVEVHDENELEQALNAGAKIIGVNNRDLRTFSIDLEISERLAGKIPADRIKVSESGINTRADVLRLQNAGFNAILVGERLMRDPDRIQALEALRGL